MKKRHAVSLQRVRQGYWRVVDLHGRIVAAGGRRKCVRIKKYLTLNAERRRTNLDCAKMEKTGAHILPLSAFGSALAAAIRK